MPNIYYLKLSNCFYTTHYYTKSYLHSLCIVLFPSCCLIFFTFFLLTFRQLLLIFPSYIHTNLHSPVLANFVATLTFALGSLYAAKTMHELLLRYVLHWPMSLFDTTPLGRVLNRFSKDVDTVDNTLPQLIRSFLAQFFAVIRFNDKFSIPPPPPDGSMVDFYTTRFHSIKL